MPCSPTFPGIYPDPAQKGNKELEPLAEAAVVGEGSGQYDVEHGDDHNHEDADEHEDGDEGEHGDEWA